MEQPPCPPDWCIIRYYKSVHGKFLLVFSLYINQKKRNCTEKYIGFFSSYNKNLEEIRCKVILGELPLIRICRNV
jgi:hypothetical protein